MASNGIQPGQEDAPAFPEEDALASGADLEEVARYAKKRGNLLKGTTAAMNAHTPKVAGLYWGNTDNGLLYRCDGTSWLPISGLLAADTVFDVTGTVGTAAAAVAGLSIAGASLPVGVPCLLRVTVHANNATSGGSRWIEFRAFDGTTGLDTFRRLSLPYPASDAWKYNASILIPVTPAGGALTLQVKADQALSVILEHAALEVMVAP